VRSYDSSRLVQLLATPFLLVGGFYTLLGWSEDKTWVLLLGIGLLVIAGAITFWAIFGSGEA